MCLTNGYLFLWLCCFPTTWRIKTKFQAAINQFYRIPFNLFTRATIVRELRQAQRGGRSLRGSGDCMLRLLVSNTSSPHPLLAGRTWTINISVKWGWWCSLPKAPGRVKKPGAWHPEALSEYQLYRRFSSGNKPSLDGRISGPTGTFNCLKFNPVLLIPYYVHYSVGDRKMTKM